MTRYIQGSERSQVTLLPECLDDYIDEDNPARVVDVFVDELDLTGLGLERVTPAITGRPGYHPLRYFSSSTSTATSIVFSPAGVWSAKPNATWS
jgi:transposase